MLARRDRQAVPHRSATGPRAGLRPARQLERERRPLPHDEPEHVDPDDDEGDDDITYHDNDSGLDFDSYDAYLNAVHADDDLLGHNRHRADDDRPVDLDDPDDASPVDVNR